MIKPRGLKDENRKLILVTFGISNPLEREVKIMTKFDKSNHTGMIMFYVLPVLMMIELNYSG